jgi:hypothetical protein
MPQSNTKDPGHDHHDQLKETVRKPADPPTEQPHSKQAILDQVSRRIAKLASAIVPRSSMVRPETANVASNISPSSHFGNRNLTCVKPERSNLAADSTNERGHAQ